MYLRTETDENSAAVLERVRDAAATYRVSVPGPAAAVCSPAAPEPPAWPQDATLAAMIAHSCSQVVPEWCSAALESLALPTPVVAFSPDQFRYWVARNHGSHRPPAVVASAELSALAGPAPAAAPTMTIGSDDHPPAPPSDQKNAA